MDDYDPRAFAPFAVTTDLVVLTVRSGALAVALVRRGAEPYLGRWALPGGFVRPQEDLAEAAARELAEETALRLSDVHLEQLQTYGAPGRDPRMRVVSVAYLALVADLPEPAGGGDAAEARWVPLAEALGSGLAFDHQRVLEDGVERAGAKLEYTALATSFCGARFTVAELRRVYEIVWGSHLDPRNFHRKVTSAPGMLTATGKFTTRGGGRPAMLYKYGGAKFLDPPIMRPQAAVDRLA